MSTTEGLEAATGEMRALTVRQPYAWAIAVGEKDVENRSRATHYRGLLAIHAAKAVYREGIDDPLVLKAIAGKEFAIGEAESSLGAVVAVALLAGCHHESTERPRNSCSSWGRPGMYHWDLAGVRPLARPVPCRGKLGLWRLPGDVAQAVRAQLETADA